MRQSPAEAAHGRVIIGIRANFQGVSYEDFLAVARRTGTEAVPQVREALATLRGPRLSSNWSSVVRPSSRGAAK